jgi:hypothetical protein
MNLPLSDLLQRLRRANSPEMLFGSDAPLSAQDLKIRYRQWVRQVHPDYNPDAQEMAGEAFVLLQRWYAAGQQKIAQGSYGLPVQIQIRSAKRLYEIDRSPLSGDLADLYPASAGSDGDLLLKIGRAAQNNDLLLAEAKTLARLDRALQGDPLRAHFPNLVEHFQICDEAGIQRQANVLRIEPETVTLAEVMAAFPNGIDAADMAWVFNRLLAALAVAHAQGIVHGAVTPAHLLLRLADHNGILIDWCYSVEAGAAVAAISPGYRAFYPPEVPAKKAATPATDLYMAAQCMVALLGGDVTTGQLPPSTPRPIAALLRGCLIPSPHRRAQDAWEIFGDFGDILRRLYGPPQFRAFSLVQP